MLINNSCYYLEKMWLLCHPESLSLYICDSKPAVYVCKHWYTLNLRIYTVAWIERYPSVKKISETAQKHSNCFMPSENRGNLKLIIMNSMQQ